MSDNYKQFKEECEKLRPAFTCKGSGINVDDNLIELAMKHHLEMNFKEAKLLFEKAAEQGHMGAQYWLGTYYSSSILSGNEEDKFKAFLSIKDAANQGHALAQNELGAIYYEGDGVFKNKTKAKYWLKKAAKQGVSEAKRNLENGEFIDGMRFLFAILGAVIIGIPFGFLIESYIINHLGDYYMGMGFFITVITGLIFGWFIRKIV